MKRNVLVTLCLLILLLTGCSSANRPTEGLEFTAENGTYVVNSYSGEEINVVIPDTYNDMPVTIIGEDCFANTDIQSVRIGSNIEEIRPGAFYNATMLKEIEIPSSVKIIGIEDDDATLTNTNKYGAFQSCINLTNVSFGSKSSIERVGYATFADCSKLERIALPDTTKYIATYAFGACTSLKTIDIPPQVSYMGLNVFSGFTAEQTINILGSTDEWLYTSPIEYQGVTVNYTWHNNCNARINYHIGSNGVNNTNVESTDGNKAAHAPDVNQIQAEIERILNSENSFRYGIVEDDGIGHGVHYYYLRSTNSNFRVLDISVNEDKESARVNCCYESDGVNYFGYYEIKHNETGWFFAEENLDPFFMTLVESDFNYSARATGEFYSSYNEKYTSLVIHSIENGIITYSLESNDNILVNNNFQQGENLTADFNSLTGEFLGFHYDTEADSWEFGAVEVVRK